jgi:predicted ATPase
VEAIMLTRLEVNGFKNLVNFTLDFGPYTCIAGANGVGKSNIFDAIRFLSLLTDHTINDAALQIRNAGEETGDIEGLFFFGAKKRCDRMRFAAEMIVSENVRDDFGREAKASSSFLRYEIAFRYASPSPTTGYLGGLLLEEEKLEHINKGQATHHIRFPHNKPKFRDSVVYNNRRASAGFISTQTDPETEQAAIFVHQDGGSRGPGRPSPAQGAVRTIIGTENTSATPTILAARREMQGWLVLAFDPAAMRRPDRFTQTPVIAENGAHIPSTLQHLANFMAQHDPNYDVFSRVSSRLSELVPVHRVEVAEDKERQLLSLEVQERSGLTLQANSISDGTLRFLALVALSEVVVESAVICMEEPENGIHPAKLPAMNRLLHDISVDVEEEVDFDNPLRQVIVATHSPYFVQLQDLNDLTLAKNPGIKSISGDTIFPLKCYPLVDSWRCKVSQDGNHERGVGLLELQSYLVPPAAGQLAFPREFLVSCN